MAVVFYLVTFLIVETCFNLLLDSNLFTPKL